MPAFGSQQLLAQVGTGSNSIFTTPTAFAQGQPFGISIQGTFTSGTIRLQKSYDQGTTWVNQDSGAWVTTTDTECDNPAGSVLWRLGWLVGDAFVGTINLRLMQS